MNEQAGGSDDREDGLGRSMRTLAAFSVMMFGLAATLAIPPTLIWIFAIRGLQ